MLHVQPLNSNDKNSITLSFIIFALSILYAMKFETLLHTVQIIIMALHPIEYGSQEHQSIGVSW